MAIANVKFVAGKLEVTDDNGQVRHYDIANYLRATDIPTGLTYTQVAAITTLANLVSVLIRTLVDRQVLDESFLEEGDYNLDDIVETIENIGGDYGEPDLSTD